MTKNICWEIDFWLEGPKYITISELTEWDMSHDKNPLMVEWKQTVRGDF